VGRIVGFATRDGLRHLLTSHFNYGFDYSQVASVRLRQAMVNSGLTFSFHDGRTLTYHVMRKETIDPVHVWLRTKGVPITG